MVNVSHEHIKAGIEDGLHQLKSDRRIVWVDSHIEIYNIQCPPADAAALACRRSGLAFATHALVGHGIEVA